MSDAEAAPAQVAAAPAKKTPKKKSAASKAKKPSSHPKYCDMIRRAITELKERGGSSRQAILKYILANYKMSNPDTAKNHLKIALRAGIKNGTLKQSKGTGASGSFRLGDKAEKKVRKPKAKKATKPKAAGAKKTKKVKKPKAAGAKKSTPKKAKKPKAKKPAGEKKAKAAKPKTKKAKSPKKAAKKAKPSKK